MKILKLATIATAVSAIRPRLQNAKPLCKDCRFFIANEWDCGKFGDVNIVSGKETFQSARSVRSDEKKCGEDAKLFETNRFKIITVPYYFFLDYWMTLPVVGLAGFYFYQLSKFLNH
jgi:hypothetical protein